MEFMSNICIFLLILNLYAISLMPEPRQAALRVSADVPIMQVLSSSRLCNSSSRLAGYIRGQIGVSYTPLADLHKTERRSCDIKYCSACPCSAGTRSIRSILSILSILSI